MDVITGKTVTNSFRTMHSVVYSRIAGEKNHSSKVIKLHYLPGGPLHGRVLEVRAAATVI